MMIAEIANGRVCATAAPPGTKWPSMMPAPPARPPAKKPNGRYWLGFSW